MNRYRAHALAIASIFIGLLAAAPVRAASMQKVNQSDWWAGITGFPSYVNMYIYVPDQVATKPPIVVVPHHCQGDAQSSYSESASLKSLGDKNGFIMIFPEATGQNCWDAGSDRSLNHNGKGDAPAVAQMVKYTLNKYKGDPDRVYSTGSSAGGIMTEALLGVFPDVFMAGVSFMGVPCGCWAESYQDNVGKPASGTGQWSGPCAGGTVSKTGPQWGDLVRSYFPGYTGHRPRLQHWHGTADTTLNYKNMAEDIKEWTNVLGLSETPTATEQNTPKSGTTHQLWKNSCYTVYETFSVSGAGHSLSVDGNVAAAYFGLDKAGGQDPETAACPGAVPGGGGTGGAGGSTGSGGTTGSGGAGGARDGGPGGRAGGSDAGIPGSGGVTGTGGNSSGGGTSGIGGASGSGGRSGSGGAPGTGGNTGSGTSGSGGATGGSEGTGGTSAKGGTTGSSGGAGPNTSSVSSGGNTAKSSSEASGGTPASSGGASGQAGSSGNGSSATRPGGRTSSGGCSYAVGGLTAHSTSTAAGLLLIAIGLTFRRQRRTRR